MNDYVLGFMFSPDGEHVALIQKSKPDWQKGLYNGIGGSVEVINGWKENPKVAMAREFLEETGVRTVPEEWEEVTGIVGADYRVRIYKTFSPSVYTVHSTTEEPVGVFSVRNLPRPIIHNLLWLIPLALDHRAQKIPVVYDKGGEPHPPHNVWQEAPIRWTVTDGPSPTILGTTIDACALDEAYLASLGMPKPEEKLAEEILAELVRARTKFPGENVTMLALMEEVGELSKASFEEPRERVREEAVQVATMAMRVVLDGDSSLDAWREKKGLDPLVPKGVDLWMETDGVRYAVR
jgi:8-oxo-dGTP diphosphatase